MKRINFKKNYTYQIFKGFSAKLQLSEGLTDKNIGPKRILTKEGLYAPMKFTHLWMTQYLKMPTIFSIPKNKKYRLTLSILIDICLTCPFFVIDPKITKNFDQNKVKLNIYYDIFLLNAKNNYFKLESCLDEYEDVINKVVGYDERLISPIYMKTENIQSIHTNNPNKVTFTYFKTMDMENQNYILLGEFDYFSIKYKKQIYRNFIIQLSDKNSSLNKLKPFRQKETQKRYKRIVGDYEKQIGLYTYKHETKDIKSMYKNELSHY